MPALDLANLVTNTGGGTKLSIDFGKSGTLTVTFDPGVYSGFVAQRLSAFDNTTDPAQLVNAIDSLSELVTAWDLVDGGKPVAADAITMQRVPTLVLSKIAAAIHDAVPAAAETSSATVVKP